MGKRCGNDKKNGGCKSKTISQCLLDAHNNLYVITKPGNYHLEHDVKGTISIQASNVCLDLCCHKLDANGADNAIIIGSELVAQVANTLSPNAQLLNLKSLKRVKNFVEEDELEGEVVEESREVKVNKNLRKCLSEDHVVGKIHHVRVHNGSICNSVVDAVLVQNSSDVELKNLTLLENSLNGVHVVDSNVVKVDNVNCFGGERALFCEGSDNMTVSNLTATEYLSTIGSVVQFTDCHNLRVHDVNVTSNVKVPVKDIESFHVATAIVSVSSSNSVNFERVKVTNNIFRDENVAPDWRTFEALMFFNCINGSLTNCDTSNNTDVTGDVMNEDIEDMILLLLFCDSFIVTNHQSNNFTCDKFLFYFWAVAALNVNDIVFDGCQANRNFLHSLSLSQASTKEFSGFRVGRYFTGSQLGKCIIRNSESNSNTIESGGKSLTTAAAAFLILFFMVQNGTMINCHANDNKILDKLPFTYNLGIFHEAGSVEIIDCKAEGNIGSSFAAGCNTYNGKCTISNGHFNNNEHTGILIGAFGFTGANTDTVISNCVIKNNGNVGTDKAYGIFLSNTAHRNILIEKCKILNTGNPFSSEAYGIYHSGATMEQVVVSDCEIIAAGGLPQPTVTINTQVPQFFPAVFTTNGPRNLYPITALPETAGSVANPTNACDAPLKSLTGKIAIVFRATSACGSAVLTTNTQNAGSVATIIVDSLNSTYGGNATQPAVSIPLANASAFTAALNAAPAGTTLTISNKVANVGTGIYLQNLNNSKVIRNEVINSSTNGIEIDGTNSKVAVIENVAMNNNKGFVLSQTTTLSTVQDNKAIGNKVSGFEQVASGSFSTSYLGNEAQNDLTTVTSSNYAGALLTTKIALQKLSLSTGNYTQPNGNASLGSRFVNVSIEN